MQSEQDALTFTEYQSFLVNGSCVRFLRPFLPFDKRLFLVLVRHTRIFTPPILCSGKGWKYLLADGHVDDTSTGSDFGKRQFVVIQ